MNFCYLNIEISMVKFFPAFFKKRIVLFPLDFTGDQENRHHRGRRAGRFDGGL